MQEQNRSLLPSVLEGKLEEVSEREAGKKPEGLGPKFSFFRVWLGFSFPEPPSVSASCDRQLAQWRPPPAISTVRRVAVVRAAPQTTRARARWVSQSVLWGPSLTSQKSGSDCISQEHHQRKQREETKSTHWRQKRDKTMAGSCRANQWFQWASMRPGAPSPDALRIWKPHLFFHVLPKGNQEDTGESIWEK